MDNWTRFVRFNIPEAAFLRGRIVLPFSLFVLFWVPFTTSLELGMDAACSSSFGSFDVVTIVVRTVGLSPPLLEELEDSVEVDESSSKAKMALGSAILFLL